jgi:hypothetical protein
VFLAGAALAVVAMVASPIRELPVKLRRLLALLFAVVWSICAAGILTSVSLPVDQTYVAVWMFIVIGGGAGAVLVAPSRASSCSTEAISKNARFALL